MITRYVSINEAYPGELDLASGKLQMFPVDGGKAGFSGFAYSADGKGAYFVSDEPIDGKQSEFRTLRYHSDGMTAAKSISGNVPWDVTDFSIADNGKSLAYISNEDGISKLYVLQLPDYQSVSIPELPLGVIGGIKFSPDSKQIALTINTATSPNDVYVIDIEKNTLTQWTRSEIGGLDASKLIAPTLIRYSTFDRVDNQPRTIPAFYYRPKGKGPFPSVILIHGGPEAQAFPTFNPSTQFMLNEMGIAVLVPNVRGSAGYGKSYLQLDNADKRKDSVKDIGALLDWIAKQPELDSQRIGVFGGSYGGYMVLASMVDYADRITAGINVVGVSDFVTFLENTEEYRRDLRRAEYGDERDPKMRSFLQSIAPLRKANKIVKPLFVAQGANDPRVPLSEANQIVAEVRANGREVWYLIFNDEGHGFRKKVNTDYFNAATMMFWQNHLLSQE